MALFQLRDISWHYFNLLHLEYEIFPSSQSSQISLTKPGWSYGPLIYITNHQHMQSMDMKWESANKTLPSYVFTFSSIYNVATFYYQILIGVLRFYLRCFLYLIEICLNYKR